jgi:hypothetical protein
LIDFSGSENYILLWMEGVYAIAYEFFSTVDNYNLLHVIVVNLILCLN